MLLSDLFKSLHYTAKRVDFFHWLLNLQANLFNFIGKLLKKSLGLFVDVLAIDIFPVVSPALERLFHIDCLQRKGSNLFGWLNFFDLIHESIEFLEFFFIVFETWICLGEDFELFAWILAPKPAVLAEAIKESVDIVLGSLD